LAPLLLAVTIQAAAILLFQFLPGFQRAIAEVPSKLRQL